MEYNTSIKFYLSEKLNKQGRAPIYMRIITDREKKEFLVAKILPHEWDEGKQRTKRNSEVNLQISNLEQKARRIQIQLEDEDRPVTARILKEYLTGKNKIKAYLIEYFDEFTSGKANNPELSPNTSALYSQTFEKIRAFVKAEYKTPDILLKEVELKFITRFDQFMVKQNLKRNTINKHHSRFRTLINQGIKEGHLKKTPYQDFPLKKVKPTPKYLSQYELNELSNHDLNKNPRLIIVRDIFLFSVYTGLRYQDAQNLEPKHIIQDENGKLFICIEQQKTKEPLEIPLREKAKRLLDKYDNDVRKISGKLLPQKSNQKINKHLKEIALLVGFSENKALTHHVARHTCATTELLGKGALLEETKTWLGHSDIKQTLIYAKITKEHLGHLADRLDNPKFTNSNY